VEHLASHILGRMALRISADWQRIYGHPIYFLETFGIRNDSAEPVTVRPTGGCWARRQDVVNNRIATCRTGRSKRFWDIHGEAVSRTAHGARMKTATRRVDVNLDELDRVLDGAWQAPLSDYEKLKEALHALAAMLARPRSTEKTSAVLGTSEGAEAGTGTQPETDVPPPARTWTQWCRGVCQFAEDCDTAREVEERGSLSGMRKRQRIRA
jgi:hypothetical protein